MKCKICNSNTTEWAEGTILKKYQIAYFKCENCGFVQTEEPYWIEEAYNDPINFSDVGYVKRNIILSKFTAKLIKRYFNKKSKFIDFGSGYGLFVRLMRDMGFDFYWSDKYCENIFAIGFEANESLKFELLSAFELFEHLTEPIVEFEKMLKLTDSILISTFLMPTDYPKPGNWWYFGEEHGQHVSLYSYKTLQYLADRYSLNLVSNQKNLHLLSKKKIGKLYFHYLNFYQSFKYQNPLSKKPTPTDKDYEFLVQKFNKS